MPADAVKNSDAMEVERPTDELERWVRGVTPPAPQCDLNDLYFFHFAKISLLEDAPPIIPGLGIAIRRYLKNGYNWRLWLDQ